MKVTWKSPKYKEAIDNHWEDQCFVDGVLAFKIFCRKSDCKCFVEDIKNNNLLEFNGGKATALKIIKASLVKLEPKVETFEDKLQKCYTEIWKKMMYPISMRKQDKADDILKKAFPFLTCNTWEENHK